MAEKCVLTSSKEYNELQEAKWELARLKPKYDSLVEAKRELEDRIEKLEQERPGLKVTIVARANNRPGVHYLVDPPYIEGFDCYIDGTGIIPSSDLRNTIYHIKKGVQEYIEKHFKSYIDEVYQKKIDEARAIVMEVRKDYEELRARVIAHNKKCWFKRNEIEP